MTRLHEDPERTTPMGLIRYAGEFLSAARHSNKGAHRPVEDNELAPAPVLFLLGQSIELSLKAYLLDQGISLREVRTSYGHGLRKCYRKARELGIGKHCSLTPDELVSLHHLDNLYESKQLQYIVTGVKCIPHYSKLDAISSRLLYAVAFKIGFSHASLPPSGA